MRTTQKKAEKKAPDRLSVLESVREFVRERLGDGASAPDLTYALAFVATDLGLVISPDPLLVFPVVLDAVSQASRVHSANAQNQETECAPEQTVIPEHTTVQ